MGAFVQHPLDNMNVHFVAVPADCPVTVYIAVAVHEILRVTAVLLAACYDITEINGSCFNEQREKFFRYILFCKDVQMLAL